MKKTVIFDLDGTLLDTLGDLTDSVNFALSARGLPERTADEVRAFIGNGIFKLVERSVPSGTGKDELDNCYALFCEHYRVNMENKTRPYDGVSDLLKTLFEAGFKLAVVTNKADFAARRLCKRFFGGYIKTVVGGAEGRKNKPAPDGVLYALAQMGSAKDGAVFIGDSQVDVQTAENAGVDFIGVLWGFRRLSELRAAGARKTAQNAEELKKMLLSLKKE